MEDDIENALESGPKTSSEIRVHLKSKKPEVLKKKSDPQLARVLQKMRRDGKITAEGGRWYGNSYQVCPTCRGKGWSTK